MSRFVAMLGQEADTGACGAMKEAARQRGWTITAVGPSFWIAAERASVTRQSLAIGEVVLIGETVGGAAPVDSRVDNIDDACVDLTRKVWGRYVAVFLTPHGRLSGVFRDPSGAIDCVVSRRRSAWLIASDTPDWLVDGHEHSGLSWGAVANVLRDSITLSTADLLQGWKTVYPGALHLPDGRKRTVWSPLQAARRSTSMTTDDLRETVDAAVAGLTRQRSSLLVEVSGGLDSAIMAASLRASAFDGNVLWLNTHGPFPESDERAYATAVAEALGVPLTILSRSARDLAKGLALEHPRSFRPSLNRLDAAYDALQADLCEAHGVEGVLTGKGGDVAFLQTATSDILADELRDRGWAALFGRTAPVLARRMRRSAWRNMRAALASARRPREYSPSANALLHPDIRGAEMPPHPWLVDMDGVGPGKRQQIVGFASNLGLHSPSRRSERAELLHPALSQPVMEAVLATPSYALTKGGHDRLLAREAFADRLPQALVHRRSKAELGGYYGRVVAANIDRLRPHLLEGHLACQGLIDRDQVEAALQVEHLIWQGGYLELMMLALVESWTKAWLR
ncbi:asparagine synthase-related protein [Brevundimonas naejangsanensis]